MVKTYIVKKGQKPTEEQIRAIKEAKKHPITFDKDCEELSPAMQKALPPLTRRTPSCTGCMTGMVGAMHRFCITEPPAL